MTIRQKLAQWFYSPGAYGLWLALDDVENWETDEYCALYKPKQGPYRKTAVARLWVATGPTKFDGHGDTPSFLGWYERRWLWKKYKSMEKRKERLKATEANRTMLYRFTRLEDPK